MAEVIRSVEKALRERGVETGSVMASYNIPKEISAGTIELDYENSKLVTQIPIGNLVDDLGASLNMEDGVVMLIGDGAIGVSPTKKTYWCNRIPEKHEKTLHSTMKELGYECTNMPFYLK